MSAEFALSPEAVGALSIVGLIVLVFLRVPIGLALVVVGFIGNLYFQGITPAIIQFQLVIWEVATNFVLVTLPLFVWMGNLAQVSGLGKDLYHSLYRLFGRVPGGLAVTSVVSSAGFGAVTGSSVATVTAMGNMLMPEMKRYRYDMGLATGSLASAGVLAILIPPSVPLVFYSAWTETSLGDLFIAGIIPGLMLATLFAFSIIFRCLMDSRLAPQGKHFTWLERITALPYMLPAISVMLIVLGCIYTGVATPTEAAAVGLVWVLILGLLRQKLSFEKLKQSIHHSAALSGNIFVLFLGGIFYSRFMAQTGLIESQINMISAWSVSSHLVLLSLVIMYLFLGAILDTFGMIILTLPFVFPLVISLGYDPVWFGIFIVMMIELSLITPPIGINVFVLQRVVPDVPLMTIFKGTFPFVLMTLFMVGLLVAFPEIALWLPRQMAQ
jgi:tripartite ATP-independent transporter DctM subunit